MKRTIITCLIMTAGVAGLGFISPWWAGAIWVVFIAGFARLSAKESILAGAFAFGLVWIVMAWYMSLHDETDIISKTGALLGGLSQPMMIVATALIAVITGIFSGWLGSSLSYLVRNESVNTFKPGGKE